MKANCFVFFIAFCASNGAADDNWTQFRGTLALGLGSGSPPVEWDVEAGTNVAWKTPIAGLRHSAWIRNRTYSEA